MNGTGALFSKEISAKNYDFKTLKNSIQGLTIIPLEYTQEVLNISNQGQVNSCVAHSLASGRAFTEYKQTGQNKIFSKSFIYANRQATDWQNSGMYTEQAMTNLIANGDIQENQWIADEEYLTLKPKFDLVKNSLYPLAYPYRASSYYEIKKDNLREFINDTKFALYYNFEVYINVLVKQSFYTAWNNNGIIPDAEDSEISYGNHLMRVVGFDKLGRLKCVNSWGTNNPSGGYCYIHFNSNIINQVMVMIDSVFESTTEPLKFVVLSDTKYDTLNEAKSKASFHNLMSLTPEKARPFYYDNKYYVQIGRTFFNTRAEAKTYKDALSLRESLYIMPVTVLNEYVLYINIPASQQQVQDWINQKVAGERNYINYCKNNQYYIGVKCYSIQEVDIEKADMMIVTGFPESYFTCDEVV
jgi:hypothetical protein